MIKILSSAALLAATLTASSATAQNERSSSVPRYHLMQLAVEASGTSAAEFQTRTETIRSCGDARKLAKSMGAEIKRNRFIRASVLPEDLQNTLAELPTGYATEVSSDETMHRVVVLCNRA